MKTTYAALAGIAAAGAGLAVIEARGTVPTAAWIVWGAAAAVTVAAAAYTWHNNRK